jgi:uncharacterized membrane protein
MKSADGSPRRPLLLRRVIRARPRLFSSLGLGAVVGAGLAVGFRWHPATAMLGGWDLAVALYLALAFSMMARSDIHVIRSRAVREDEGQAAVLTLTVVAALASLAAIFVELGGSATVPGGPRPLAALVLAVVTIVLSWTFIHTIFALHYAHDFYDESSPGGLAFPGGDAEPDYWDFVYFSFVIGMTSQVSDVAVTSKPVRRTVAAHGVVAFLFNATLLALTVNLAASAI